MVATIKAKVVIHPPYMDESINERTFIDADSAIKWMLSYGITKYTTFFMNEIEYDLEAIAKELGYTRRNQK